MNVSNYSEANAHRNQVKSAQKTKSYSQKSSRKQKMAVMTTTMTKSEPNEQQIVTKKHHKTFDKTRPITATLDHPLILDIRFLKKLDMTTFTKKGLIALSKFCGISLINKTESKRKLNKCLKTINHSKKQITNENGYKGSSLDLSKKDYPRVKRKPPKQVAKVKPRIRFKISDDISGPEEDSSDVVCKRHDKTNKPGVNLKLNRDNILGKKAIVDDIFKGSFENIIPEPCKTCSRSEYPERFHSHPKVSSKVKKQNEKMNLEEQFKHSLTTRDSDEEGKTLKGKKSPSVGSPQKSPKSKEEKRQSSSPGKCKVERNSPTKSTSSGELRMSPETGSSKKLKNYKKSSISSPPESKSSGDNKLTKKTLIKNSTNHDNEDAKQTLITPVEEALKFVTGCYVCGRQMSPKQRLRHEESCILEWRTQNSFLPPEQRKAEPVRPDYRFTASGDLDPEGTFESIWANHMDSLVPCKKCGRKFFPDRIERHENCCNNLPVRVKYK